MRALYEAAVLVDTAAVVALFDASDALHDRATDFFAGNASDVVWFALNATSHESYTRVRYSLGHAKALAAYEWLRSGPIQTLRFEPEDEAAAMVMLRKYRDHALSFHDALCAAVMLRIGLYKVFTFDRDFWMMGFSVLPGTTR